MSTQVSRVPRLLQVAYDSATCDVVKNWAVTQLLRFAQDSTPVREVLLLVAVLPLRNCPHGFQYYAQIEAA